MNVLITSASRKVSLVRAFQHALAKEGGGRVVAADANPRSPALYLADQGRIVPKSDDAGFLSFLLDLCESDGIDLVVPTRDEELPLFAEGRARFAEVGVRVMVSPREPIRICQDKRLFADFCVQHRHGVPRTFLPGEVPTPGDFPVFVKPRIGKGGKHTARVDTAESLALVLSEFPDALVQTFVGAPEYTVDFFADFEGRVLSVVPRERVAVFGGESFVGRTRRHPGLIADSVRLAGDLGLVGHATIQAFLDGDGAVFVEVNPRYGGGASLGFAAGAPTPWFLVRLLQGKAVERRIDDFEDDFVMLRYTTDLFLSGIDLLREPSS